MQYIICFNTTGSDSITYLDGRKSLQAAHKQAMKHYNAMKKLKGSFSHQYGIGKGVKGSRVTPSQVNEKQFTIAEYWLIKLKVEIKWIH